MIKTFIIAEAGVNHNGSVTIAKKLIDVAATAKADAVKFQTFRADQLLTTKAPKAAYQLANTLESESQHAMIKKLELSEKDHAELIAYCQQKNIQFLSTPFDLISLDLLANRFALPMLKLASGEITNAPLLLNAAKSGKSLILSTGMSTLGDIEFALSVLAFGYLNQSGLPPKLDNFLDAYRSAQGQQMLQEKVILLHCTTDYPALFSEINLKAMDTLCQAFNLPVGYSDHTQGIEIAIAAVARGAICIEKHFTLDRKLPGPDHQASLEPEELTAMIQAIRNVEIAIGDGHKIPRKNEFKNRAAARKSLVALHTIRKGEVFTEANLGIKRPGTGTSGIYYWEWLGKIAQKDYHENELIMDI